MNLWRFEDSGEIVEFPCERPCAHCGLEPVDDRDACFGPDPLPGIISACCGHGEPADAYLIYETGTDTHAELRGFTVKHYKIVARDV